MNKNEPKGYALFAVILAVNLLLPILSKVAHALDGHHHEVCLASSEYHWHSGNSKCDWPLYKLTSYNWTIISYEPLSSPYLTEDSSTLETRNDSFLYLLGFSLRAPPFSS